jgi:hypothetical protein
MLFGGMGRNVGSRGRNRLNSHLNRRVRHIILLARAYVILQNFDFSLINLSIDLYLELQVSGSFL